MSQAQQYGPERAMMQSPHGAGQFVRGSGNINAKLAQGWTIVANDHRNHLMNRCVINDCIVRPPDEREVICGQDPKEEKAEPSTSEVSKAAIPETPKAVEVQHKRPRIRDNNARQRGTR